MSDKTKKTIFLALTVVGLIGIAATVTGESTMGMLISAAWTVLFGSFYMRIAKRIERANRL